MTPEAKSIGSVLQILEYAAQEYGHVYLPKSRLYSQLAKRFGITDGAGAIQAAVSAGHVVVRGDRVYLKHLDEAEQAIADGVKRMLGGKRRGAEC